MYTDKQSMLNAAPAALNRPDIPWQVSVQGDSIVAYWKWMDATFFAPHEINQQVQQYCFTVTLNDNGKWTERDTSEQQQSKIGFNNGKLSLGGSKSTFSGNKTGKSAQFGLGQNNQTGQFGLVGFRYDTTQVKNWVRNWLTQYGWQKAGLFG